MKAVAEKKFSLKEDSQFDSKTQTAADHLMREQDRVLRWKKIHKLLRQQNKKARKEQDKIAKECAEVREEKIFKREKSEILGLRFGVSLPPMTYHALVQSDELIDGHSDLHHPDKEGYETKNATNQIVKDLEKAFPQYKVT
jgi:hypothetical protein